MDLGSRPGRKPTSQMKLGGEVNIGKSSGRLLGWGAMLNEEGRMEKVAIVRTNEGIRLLNPNLIHHE